MKFISQAARINIPVEKFTKYALNEKADKDKTIAFEKALGYNLNNVDKLIKDIHDNISKFPAKYKGNKGYGDLYEVVMILKGANGKFAKVLTAWMEDEQLGEVRLLTVHIDA